MNVANARVLVTGGSSGIGKATAGALSALGAKVAVCGRHRESIDAGAAETGATPFVADVSNEGDVIALIPQVVAALGGYDVLINNAGFGRFAPLIEMTVADMRAVWETNVLGATLMARESAKYFIGKSYGNIVNIGSTAGSRGAANGTAYSSSKFAVHSLTECWRAELRKHNIRVMQVNPSEVLTDFSQRARGTNRPEDPSKLHASDIAATIVNMLGQEDRAMITDVTVWATNPT